MFETDAAERGLIDAGIAIDPAGPREAWDATLGTVLARAGLARPSGTWMQTGGRGGRHTEHLGHLLAEMQHLARTYPGARW
jgi:ring-1,2-phenylacetyl-CoA epoxidase subunit PaaC